MPKQEKFFFIGRYGNGLYTGSIRVFTSKEMAYEYLLAGHKSKYEYIKTHYSHNPDWAERWKNFEFYLKMIGNKYYVGTLNDFSSDEKNAIKNIPTNKILDWLTNHEPL